MNTGQFIASLSGLSGVTAAQHLAAITTGGGVIIALRSDVQITTPALRITSRPKRSGQPQSQEREQSTHRAREKSKYASVRTETRRTSAFTATDEIFVTTTIT